MLTTILYFNELQEETSPSPNGGEPLTNEAATRPAASSFTPDSPPTTDNRAGPKTFIKNGPL